MSAKPSKNTKYFIHSFIGIVVMFGFGLLPPFAPLTPLGMKYIGILLGLIYLWSLVEMLWPSIMALVAVILTGQFSGAAITPKAFGCHLRFGQYRHVQLCDQLALIAQMFPGPPLDTERHALSHHVSFGSSQRRQYGLALFDVGAHLQDR